MDLGNDSVICQISVHHDCILLSALVCGLVFVPYIRVERCRRNVLAGTPSPVKRGSGSSLHPSVIESCSKNRENESISFLSLADPRGDQFFILSKQ